MLRAADRLVARKEKVGRPPCGGSWVTWRLHVHRRAAEALGGAAPAAPEVPASEVLAERGAELVGEVWRVAVAQAQEQVRG